MTQAAPNNRRPTASCATPSVSQSTGVLLFHGDYYGTLASARCLGRRGVDVVLADPSRHTRTAASRYVRRWVESPEASQGDRLIRWLLDADASLEGRVLFPASDDLVFLFAAHQEELRQRYRLFIPSFTRIATILNKRCLYEACTRVDVRIPRTWFPRDIQDLAAITPEIDVHVLLKPRTQVQFRTGEKGAEVTRGADLVEACRRFMRENPYGPGVGERDPDITMPLVQTFHREAECGIYSISGFADGSDQPLLRAARKVLQRPRRLGVGLCFESASVLPMLSAKITALCRELGYFGIFEVEFIESQGEFLLIDFNPRGYSQMAFEDARGLPLPYLQYLSAIGDADGLARLRAEAVRWQPDGEYAFCQGTLLQILRTGQRLGQLTGRTPEPWAAWTRRYRGRMIDAVSAADDPGPRAADRFSHIRDFLKHPRSFLRSLQRHRPAMG